jgi:hypothetical protein
MERIAAYSDAGSLRRQASSPRISIISKGLPMRNDRRSLALRLRRSVEPRESRQLSAPINRTGGAENNTRARTQRQVLPSRPLAIRPAHHGHHSHYAVEPARQLAGEGKRRLAAADTAPTTAAPHRYEGGAIC